MVSEAGEVRLERRSKSMGLPLISRSLSPFGHLSRPGGLRRSAAQGLESAQVRAMARVEVLDQSFFRFWWRPKLVGRPPSLEKIVSEVEYGSIARRFDAHMEAISMKQAFQQTSCCLLAAALCCLLLQAVAFTWWGQALLEDAAPRIWWSSLALGALWILAILGRMAYFALLALEDLRRTAYAAFAVDASLGSARWRVCEDEGRIHFEVQATELQGIVVDEIPEVGEMQLKVGKSHLELVEMVSRPCLKCGEPLKEAQGHCDGCGHRV